MARTWTDEDVRVALVESTERSGVPLVVTDAAALRRAVSLSRVELEEAS